MDHRVRIIELLEMIRQRDFARNDRFKVRAYDTVIKQLKQHTSPINKIEDLAGFKGIGEKIKKKIEEIISTGDLDQVKTIDEEVGAVTELAKMFGIGPVKARELYSQHGIKSVDELRQHTHLLNDKQLLGLKYVGEFDKRIPRAEMDKHWDMIKTTVSALDPKLRVEMMGSYRRGAVTSGDIDVLITHDDDPTECGDILQSVVKSLADKKYIVDNLALGSKKYNGVCKVKRHKTFRRIDIMYTTSAEFPFALMYFTGSAEFNINMRALALEKGYTMNEHGMKYTIGDKVGQPVKHAIKDETDLFKFLGLKFIAPENRAPNVLQQYML
jgi:DNA polymerase beta